jgi:hypothetical protein
MGGAGSSASPALRTPRRLVAVATLVLAVVAYWLLPIDGQVLVTAGGSSAAWPRLEVEPGPAEAILTIGDVTPWGNVVATVDGRHVPLEPVATGAPGVWRWRGAFKPPAAEAYTVAFYRDCNRGCVERGRLGVGTPDARTRPAPPGIPTQLGVVFAAPGRDWHGRAGWSVELLYCRAADGQRWGQHGLADTVAGASRAGLRTLVRVAYDVGQSIPPADDQVALAGFLDCLERAARDDRLQGVYGYVIGSGFNTAAENRLGAPVTARWYARVFNGYGLAPGRGDTVVERLRAANPRARVLVGPVTPWATDQAGELPDPSGAPWLDYMNTLVAALDEAARARAAAGVALTAPDGFAVQAPGRVDAPALGGRGAEEPRTDLPDPRWPGAQAGFRVYRDWLAIVNRHGSTAGRPLYITATNTFVADAGVPPAQNYPAGWLRTALAVVAAEPQVRALIWFLDEPTEDGAWDFFSLTRRAGRLVDAADDLDALLRG